MRRFFGLIVNEYVKILCKVSTKIMLAMIIIVALGFNFIIYVAANAGNNYYYTWGADEYINQAESDQYEGWERDVEMYTYFKDNGVDIVWRDDNYEDNWRRNAIYTLFTAKYDMMKEAETAGDTDKIETINIYVKDVDTAIKNKDWKLYYNAELSRAEKMADGEYSQTETYQIDVWQWKYRIDNDIAPESWKYQLVTDIAGYKYEISNYGDITEIDENYGKKTEAMNNLAIAEYRLENNAKDYTYEGIESLNDNISSGLGFWKIFAISTMTISVISVLIIVVAGSLLSSEFSAGTVKFLLINPVKRWKIFAAKYVSVLSITLISVFILYIFNLIFAGIFFGFNSIGAPFLSAENGSVIIGSSFGYIALKYLLGSVGMACMATFAFAISSLVRNSALSIGLGVFLFLSGNTIISILNMLGVYQAKYILFANTDLNAVINGSTGFINHTLAFALINIAVYMTVFLWTAWDGFVRNDIK